jgi:hypothetical protein
MQTERRDVNTTGFSTSTQTWIVTNEQGIVIGFGRSEMEAERRASGLKPINLCHAARKRCLYIGYSYWMRPNGRISCYFHSGDTDNALSFDQVVALHETVANFEAANQPTEPFVSMAARAREWLAAQPRSADDVARLARRIEQVRRQHDDPGCLACWTHQSMNVSPCAILQAIIEAEQVARDYVAPQPALVEA